MQRSGRCDLSSILSSPVMKTIYEKLWKLARPYYEKGRPMDIPHIEWMMKDAEYVCEKEKLDDSILIPLCILHDVGYSAIPKDNPFNLDVREAHMREGARIATEILKLAEYPDDKAEEIVYFVSVHDAWALGRDDLFKKYKILGVFNDLDYMWMATREGFGACRKYLDLNPRQMLDHLTNNEKLKNRPFATPTTHELYETYLIERKREAQQKPL